MRHKTANCNPEIRNKNLRKLTDLGSHKRSREQSGNLPGSKRSKPGRFKGNGPTRKAEDECKTCKKAGRPYRHPSKTCNYAPGGPWHNKSGEELRALQKQFYEARNRARGAKNSTNTAEQKKPPRKQARGNEKEAEKSLFAEQPLWSRHFSLIGEQDLGPTATHMDLPSKKQKKLGGVCFDTPGCLNEDLTLRVTAENSPGYTAEELRVTACRPVSGFKTGINLASCSAHKPVVDPMTAMVIWKPEENCRQNIEEHGELRSASSSCQKCQPAKAVNYKDEKTACLIMRQCRKPTKSSGWGKGAIASIHMPPMIRE